MLFSVLSVHKAHWILAYSAQWPPLLPTSAQRVYAAKQRSAFGSSSLHCLNKQSLHGSTAILMYMSICLSTCAVATCNNIWGGQEQNSL